MKPPVHPKLLFVRYAPSGRPSPYRLVHLIDAPIRGRMVFRDAEAETEGAARVQAELEAAWLDGARVMVLLGTEVFKAFGYEGSFRDFRGTWLDPPADRTDRAWTVIATIDPASRAAYIRNGFETYRSDLAKALAAADAGSTTERPERFQTGADLNRIVAWLRATPAEATVGCDIESDGLSFHNGAEMVCLGIARTPEEACVIPWRRGRGVSYWSGGEETLLLTELRRFFAGRRTVWHNGVFFDVPFLIASGFPLKPDDDLWDTMLMHKAIEPEAPHSLAYVASRYATRRYWKDEFKNRPGSIYAMRPEDLWTYNARDAAITLEVFEAMLDKLPEAFSMAAAPLVIHRRLHEVRIDEDSREDLRADIQQEVAATEARLRDLGRLPEGFNFASGVHINAFIFNVRRQAEELRTLERYATKARELQSRLDHFDADHSGWKPERAERERERFKAQLERLGATGLLAQAKAHVALLAAIQPLYDVSRLNYLPRIKPGGLYSFDDLSRERLEHQLKRRRDATQHKLENWSGTKVHDRFVRQAREELAQLEALLAWLERFEYRQVLLSLSRSVASSEDIMAMPLEALVRFGRHVRPGIGAQFYTIMAPPAGFTAQQLGALARNINGNTFVILMRKECVILETIPSEATRFEWDACGRTLAAALDPLKESTRVDAR